MQYIAGTTFKINTDRVLKTLSLFYALFVQLVSFD